MAGKTFDFDSKGIGALLKAGQLVVPPNQRSYAWEEMHVRNFLEDLNQAITNNEPDYFLGTVVLVQGVGRDAPSIADGQQRIATTSIVLARLRDALFEFGREMSARSVDNDFLRTIDRDSELAVTRLSLNTEDNEFFSRAILVSPFDPDFRLENTPKPTRTSNERLLKASELVKSFFQQLTEGYPAGDRPGRLLHWVDFLEKRAGVVVVTVQDEIGAYRIFETLNDRGLKASQADILKNYFYSRAGKRLNEALTAWSSVAAAVEALGGDDAEKLITYIRHLWITDEGPTRERDLAASIRAKVTSEHKALAFLTSAAARVQDYVALSNAQHDRWAAYDASVRQNIEVLAESLQVEQIRPLLFAVSMHFTAEEAKKAFQLFVSWSVRFLIVGGRGGLLDAQYSQRAQDVGTKKITKATELREAMGNYVPTDLVFQEEFATARVSRAHLARYYLRAIERHRQHQAQPEFIPNDNVADVNLEHVLPLSPSADWNVTPEEARASQKLIGNMVLLSAGQNKEIANLSFEKKKPVLLASEFITTKEVASFDQWTPVEMRKRQQALAMDAVDTWTLKFA